jgi:hypothetical protein
VTDEQPIHLTYHVMDSYRIHHPTSNEDEIRLAIKDAIARGHVLTPETAAQVCGRYNVDHESRYFVAHDCQGMFVMAADGAVITYLRFQNRQQALVWSWFRGKEPIPGETTISKGLQGAVGSRDAKVRTLLARKNELSLRMQALTDVRDAKIKDVERLHVEIKALSKEQGGVKAQIDVTEQQIASLSRPRGPGSTT